MRELSHSTMAEAVPAMTVVIITGNKVDIAWAIDELSTEHGFAKDLIHRVPLTEHLKKSKDDKIGWQEDHEFDATVRHIFSQSKFGDIVVDTLQCINKGSRIVLFESGSGCHRASVCGKITQHVANTICNSHLDRLFQCELWMLHKFTKRQEYYNALDDVKSWLHEPQYTIESGWDGSTDTEYGYSQCRKYNDAFLNFDAIYNSINDSFQRAVTLAEAEPEVTTPDDEDVTPNPSATSKFGASLATSDAPRRRRTISGDGGTFEVPDWVTFEKNDLSVWWEVLEWYECDEVSRQKLFLLSQRDFDSAYRLMFELIRKRHDGERIRSGTKWLMSATLSAQSDFVESFHPPKKSRKGK
jgi:hypothetical protein